MFELVFVIFVKSNYSYNLVVVCVCMIVRGAGGSTVEATMPLTAGVASRARG